MTAMDRARTVKRHPTISDIAGLAGVAPMTVSRVLNGNPRVSSELRARVERAVAQLNYTPNWLARGLKHRRTHVVGILLPDISNPFCGELARGINEVLSGRGYCAFLSSTDPRGQTEAQALKAFLDYRLDGVIVAARGGPAGNEAIARFVDRGIPLVAIGRAVEGMVDRVTAAHRSGGYQATKHLIELGHRRIAFIGASAPDSPLERFQGYCAALAEHHLPLDGSLIVGVGQEIAYTTQKDGYEGMSSLLSRRHPPTAVFARNDFTAIGALCAASDLGFTVPKDVAVAGFDDVPIAAYTSPPLTTVRQPMTEQGQEAARLLLDRIEGRESGGPREICFPCKLVERASTRTMAPRHATVHFGLK